MKLAYSFATFCFDVQVDNGIRDNSLAGLPSPLQYVTAKLYCWSPKAQGFMRPGGLDVKVKITSRAL